MNKVPTDIHGNKYNRNLLVLVLIIGSFCTVLNGTLLSTALPSIMRSFNISTATAEWLSTAFLLVNGVMIPISAWLINRFGSRKMYVSLLYWNCNCSYCSQFSITSSGKNYSRIRSWSYNATSSNNHAFHLPRR